MSECRSEAQCGVIQSCSEGAEKEGPKPNGPDNSASSFILCMHDPLAYRGLVVLVVAVCAI
jgi:hypothetical protein